MTDAEFNAYVRSLLNEDKEVFWTDEEIATYKKVAIITVTSIFWNLLLELKKYPLTYSLSAGENNLDLPVDWYKIKRLEVAETGRPLKPIPAEDLSLYYAAPGDEPVGYTFVRGKIRVLPDMTAAKADYLRLWYLPRMSTLDDLPDALHPLVAVETVLAGRTKDENVSPYLANLRDRFEWVARKDLVQHQTQSPITLEDEYELDD